MQSQNKLETVDFEEAALELKKLNIEKLKEMANLSKMYIDFLVMYTEKSSVDVIYNHTDFLETINKELLIKFKPKVL